MKKGLAGVAVAFLAWALLSILWAPPYLVTATPYRVDQDPSSRGLVFETIRIPSEDLLLEGGGFRQSRPGPSSFLCTEQAPIASPNL